MRWRWSIPTAIIGITIGLYTSGIIKTGEEFTCTSTLKATQTEAELKTAINMLGSDNGQRMKIILEHA